MIRKVALRALPFVFFVSTADAGTTFSLLELGTLGGSASVAVDLNNAGQVVGWSYLSGGPESAADPHATIWQGGGAPIDLGVSGGARSQGLSINSTGQVVGLSGAANYQATLWTGTAAVNLGTLGGLFSIARGINNQGQVVGGSQNAAGDNRAFVWTNGSMTGLASLPGTTHSGANDINNQGQIVGSSEFGGGVVQATIWNSGIPSSLETPFFGGTWSGATGINNAGQVVGVAALPGVPTDFSLYHATLWTNGVAVDLGPGAAEDINSSGQIVGVYSLTTGDGRAKFWDADGQGKDLTSLLDASGAGWTLYQATGINDAGQIVGAGVNASGQYRGFLLTPVSDVHGVPIPTLGAGLPGLLMTVAGFIGWRRSRRSRKHLSSLTSASGCPAVACG